ncbi:MAG: pilus assembly protein [Actinomycetales bacterium]|nr:pilus assembly protein [Actinomycetales bacterium]
MIRQVYRWGRRRVGRADDGRAIVEFVFLGVLMIVPLIYLVLILGRIQAAAYSVTTAAREAGRAYTSAANEAEAAERAQAAARIAFADFGFDSGSTVRVVCDGSPCLRSEGRVSVTASLVVQLPLVPAFLSDAVASAVPVSATHVASVDRFGGR